MFDFNLSENKVVAQSSSRKPLKPWEIHDVIFKGIRLSSFEQNSKETGEKITKYILNFDFDGFDPKDPEKKTIGSFSHSIFLPAEAKDGERMVWQAGTENEATFPSSVESFQYELTHIGENIAPKAFEKFKKLSFNLPADTEKMFKVLEEVFKAPVDAKFETKLKLITDKKGRARIPYCVNINKDGESYFSNNFIGTKCFWSEYELPKKNAYKTNGPTAMGSTKPKKDALPGGAAIADALSSDDKAGLQDDLDDLPF